MIDKKFIGFETQPFTTSVEKGQLRLFAKATGEARALYSEEEAAAAAGYDALPAPLTYTYSLNLMHPDPFAILDQMGIDLGKVLHGEQHFEYLGTPVCAGDKITLVTKIVDIYDKKAGALEFIEMETDCRNQLGAQVVKMKNIAVVKN